MTLFRCVINLSLGLLDMYCHNRYEQCYTYTAHFVSTEIIQCKDNTTKCGYGCLMTDEGAVCVCPEGSVLQEDGQACTGMGYTTVHQLFVMKLKLIYSEFNVGNILS